jgi:hypothetical protein
MMKPVCLSLLILALGAHPADGQSVLSDLANTYFAASGFDRNGDGQPETASLELQGKPGIYLQSALGGATAPMAYYPEAARDQYDQAKATLIGNGTYERPQRGSALEFRTLLYSKTGENALQAWYTDAAQAFTPKLLALLQAEEQLRRALRIDPYYRDALNGLLEVYYARAEGFMLIGNDYLAKAYRHKFDRDLDETRSIVELEVGDMDRALICYETGFREFMKLFNPDFTGLSGLRRPDLDIDAEWLFFERRFENPNDPGGNGVAFESLRGQTNTIGVSSRALNDARETIAPVQGSPTKEIEIQDMAIAGTLASDEITVKLKERLSAQRVASQLKQVSALDAPVKFQLPIITGAPTFRPGNSFILDFRFDTSQPVKTLEMVIEFNNEKLMAPTRVEDLDFSDSIFTAGRAFYGPGSTFNGVQLLANQMLVRVEAAGEVSGTGLSVVKVPFAIKLAASGAFSIYAGGSAGSLLSGFKDVAILYRLAAAHANAVQEKVRRLYNLGSQQSIADNIQVLQDETQRIGGWFEHIQALLAECATPEELGQHRSASERHQQGIRRAGQFERPQGVHSLGSQCLRFSG